MLIAEDAHVTYKVFSSGKPVGAGTKLLGQGRTAKVNSVHAVRGISFTASEGETIGVVGHNGSGKSTLFRALSGLIPTSQGRILAADRPVLLGVNAALMPQLSGEANIKLGLLAMGFSSQEAEEQVEEIADFAELNDFIGHPMRTYSSGMGARLRFAIASAKAHSILLLDEALAVGDRRFRLKSEARIKSLKDDAGLVMIVSHSAGTLKETCDRVLWIHKGELRADGDAKEVVDEYTRWTKDPTSVGVGAASPATPAAKKPAAKKSAAPKPAASKPAAPTPAKSAPAASTPKQEADAPAKSAQVATPAAPAAAPRSSSASTESAPWTASHVAVTIASKLANAVSFDDLLAPPETKVVPAAAPQGPARPPAAGSRRARRQAAQQQPNPTDSN